jgi:hypothetical protein
VIGTIPGICPPISLVLFGDGNEELKNIIDSVFNATLSLYDFPVKVFGPFMLSLIVYLVFFFTRRGFPQSLDDEEIAMFPTKWRNIKHMEHMVCLRCDTANSGYWVQNGKNDYLDFTTNRD